MTMATDAMPPLIGILGGMGPMATVDLMAKIVANTPAARDQDHVPVVAWNVPQVPDRQKALDLPAFDGGSDGGSPAVQAQSPLPAMLDGIARLNEAGATRIVIACNTAHHWYDALAAASRAPILHIADVTLDALLRSQEGTDAKGAVGLIATRGMLRTGLYQQRFTEAGLACLEPTDEEMDRLFGPGCYAVKCNRIEEGGRLFDQLAHSLRTRGATRLVLACTEVPVGLAQAHSALLPVCIDPTLALARACIAYWLERR